MEELESSWNKLALTENEQETVEIDEEETEEDPNRFCLIGSLWSIRPFNHRAMLETMKTLWKPLKGVDMDIISDNRFLFTFYNRIDKEQVLERRPWTFEKHVLLLQEINSMDQPSKITLKTTVFWLRMYDLPIGAMKEHILHRLGSKAGHVIEIGYQRENYLGGQYARVRVEVDVTKPLARGAQLQVKGKRPMFIQFRYERLQDFCFRCGRLGHTERDCEEEPASESSTQYHEDLRAPTGLGRTRSLASDRNDRSRTTAKRCTQDPTREMATEQELGKPVNQIDAENRIGEHRPETSEGTVENEKNLTGIAGRKVEADRKAASQKVETEGQNDSISPKDDKQPLNFTKPIVQKEENNQTAEWKRRPTGTVGEDLKSTRSREEVEKNNPKSTSDLIPASSPNGPSTWAQTQSTTLAPQQLGSKHVGLSNTGLGDGLHPAGRQQTGACKPINPLSQSILRSGLDEETTNRGRLNRWRRTAPKNSQRTFPPNSSLPDPEANQQPRQKRLHEQVDAMEVDPGEKKRPCTNTGEPTESNYSISAALGEPGCRQP